MMRLTNVKNLLASYNQEQVLRFYGELSADGQEKLLAQIEEIDWALLSNYSNREDLSGKGEIAPLKGLHLKDIVQRREEFFAIGKEALQKGKVGAVLLAGGQGTRLGSDKPKGAFSVGVTRPLYIFEQQMNNLLEVCKACGTSVPLFVMTSEKNDEATREFFGEHGYFGYPKEDIYFFRQEMAACVDFNGKILLEEKGRIATSPNGNGGWYTSLLHAGLGEVIAARGIEWLNVFAVDNVLQRIADPVFVGATIESGKNCGAKCVRKNDPHERVGVLCLQNGVPNVIEYYEISEELANARDEKGELLYADGAILNYLFRVSKLQETLGDKVPVHVVKKKIPYVNEEGNVVSPAAENGFKFETLILDMVKLMETCLPFEVEREKEFAPIKNMTGIDSVESARELLKKNGVIL